MFLSDEINAVYNKVFLLLQSFGESVAADIVSKQWDLRESSLKTVAQSAVQELARECLGTLGDCAVLDVSLDRCLVVLAALQVINTLIDDPVYKVFVASLVRFLSRTLSLIQETRCTSLFGAIRVTQS